MFSIPSDAVCANKHVNVATPLAPHAALCASKPGGRVGAMKVAFSLLLGRAVPAPVAMLEFLHCLRYMPFANVQCTSGSNLGPTRVLSHFTKQHHGKNCFQTYVYAPPNLLSSVLLHHAL